jgi:hypothetical protein
MNHAKVHTLSPFDLEKEKALLKAERADRADAPLTEDEEFVLEQALDRARFLNRERGKLNLRWQLLRNRGILSLTRILRNRGMNHYIVEFELGGCEIGDDGIRSLCDWLREDKTVERLGLSCNAYGDPGMVYLAALVKANETLKVLDLSGNRCTGSMMPPSPFSSHLTLLALSLLPTLDIATNSLP